MPALIIPVFRYQILLIDDVRIDRCIGHILSTKLRLSNVLITNHRLINDTDGQAQMALFQAFHEAGTTDELVAVDVRFINCHSELPWQHSIFGFVGVRLQNVTVWGCQFANLLRVSLPVSDIDIEGLQISESIFMISPINVVVAAPCNTVIQIRNSEVSGSTASFGGLAMVNHTVLCSTSFPTVVISNSTVKNMRVKAGGVIFDDFKIPGWKNNVCNLGFFTYPF
jgi:hypothetical protein